MGMLKKILWAIFGNDDDPNPPADYQLGWPQWRRRLYWFAFRNPLHNLTFYVLGVAGKPFERVVIYPPRTLSNLVFRPEGWYIAVVKYKWLRLPFVSYQGAGLIKKFYVGWRERGNLGAKLTLNIQGGA